MAKLFNIFNRGPSAKQIDKLIGEVNQNNQLYQAIYNFQVDGINIRRDVNMSSFVKKSYEGNPDAYSIAEKVATMLSRVPIGVFNENDEVTDTPLNELLATPNNYQTWMEYIKLWEIFYMITGNGISYAPTLEGGNDAGKLLEGLFVVPTQHVEIESGGWRQPVKNYLIDIDMQEHIPAKDIIHVRFPNMSYQDGANFMGMSPVKVAVNVIDAVNHGYITIANAMERGMPPGILTRKNEEYDKTRATEHQTQLEKVWNRKYGKSSRAGMPVITQGDINWIKLGFDNFRDLQIIENSEHGLRVLCNIWGVPSQVYNDVAGTTFNNQREARKAIYTNRIIPDLEMKLSYLNQRLSPAYGDLKIKAKWDEIEELQQAKADKVTWVVAMKNGGLISGDEGREMLGEEPTGLPGMDKPMIPFNLMPVDQVSGGMPTDDEVDKALKDGDIDDYKGLRKVV